MRRLRYALILLMTAGAICVCAALPWIVGAIDSGRQSPWDVPVREIEIDAVKEGSNLSLAGKLAVLSQHGVYEIGSFNGGDFGLGSGEHDNTAGLEKVGDRTADMLAGLRDAGLFDGEGYDTGTVLFHKLYAFERDSLTDGFVFWKAEITYGGYERVGLFIDDETGALMACSVDLSGIKGPLGVGSAAFRTGLVTWFTDNLGDLPELEITDMMSKGIPMYICRWNDPVYGEWVIELVFTDTFSTSVAPVEGIRKEYSY